MFVLFVFQLIRKGKKHDTNCVCNKQENKQTIAKIVYNNRLKKTYENQTTIFQSNKLA